MRLRIPPKAPINPHEQVYEKENRDKAKAAQKHSDSMIDKLDPAHKDGPRPQIAKSNKHQIRKHQKKLAVARFGIEDTQKIKLHQTAPPASGSARRSAPKTATQTKPASI